MGRAAGWSLVAALGAACAACGPTPGATTPKSGNGVDSATLVVRARTEAAAQDVDGADRDYRRAYFMQPDPSTLAEYVALLVHVGRDDRALELAAAYRKDHPDTSGDQVYADALLLAGRGSDALVVADAMVSRDAKAAAAHDVRGRALLATDKLDDGLVELRAARDLAPDDGRHHARFGVALAKSGKADEALAELKQAVKLAPDDADANIELAVMLRDKGARGEARPLLEHVIKVAPTNGRAYFELARLDNAEEKDEQAEAELAKAVANAPYESLYWYAYGEVFRLHERAEEAMRAYQRALALPHPAPKARAKLGVVYARLQKWPDAERELTAVQKDFANDALVQLSLGDVYAATDRGKLAMESYKRFLELAQPDDAERPRVQQAMAKLHGH
jgi:tetratricopeptide (TPR) repeat protein